MFEHIDQISNNLIQIKWTLISIAVLFWVRETIDFCKYLQASRRKKLESKKTIGFSNLINKRRKKKGYE